MMKLQSKEQLMGVHVKAAKNALSIKNKAKQICWETQILVKT